MDEVLHANIFFFIASGATIIFCILVAIAMYQVIRILKLVRSIVERIEEGSEQIADDVAAFREYVQKGNMFTKVLGIIMSTKFGGSRRRFTDDD